MTAPQPLTPFVESYRFWDVVTLWARERLEHEEIVARALARAVICDGLRLQSVDPRWLKGDDRGIEFKGYPYVGFCAKPGAPMCVLRSEALEHLLAVSTRVSPEIAEYPDSGKFGILAELPPGADGKPQMFRFVGREAQNIDYREGE